MIKAPSDQETHGSRTGGGKSSHEVQPVGTVGRNRYLDIIRVVALFRVSVLHSFFIGWMSFIVPSMGLLFALGGSMMAASLDRRSFRSVVFDRSKRILVPLWVFALCVVPAMVALGWAAEVNGTYDFQWQALLWWLAPVLEPQGSDHYDLLWRTLWYIRTYLWFVVASGVLLFLFRRAPYVVMAAGLAISAAVPVDPFLAHGPLGAAGLDFLTYLGFWLLGFAHHDGYFQKLTVATHRTLLAVAVLFAAYVLVAVWDTPDLQLTTLPVLNVAWSLPVLLVVLRWQPSMQWLVRHPRVERWLSRTTSRAVTIYLWHPVAILLSQAGVGAVMALLPFAGIGLSVLSPALQLLGTVVILGGLVGLFGLVECRAKRGRRKGTNVPSLPQETRRPQGILRP